MKKVFERIKGTIEVAGVDLGKFIEGNSSAGSRVRAHMQDIKKAAQDLRVMVQDIKNKVKEKKTKIVKKPVVKKKK